jgi:hypothetical protein
MEFVDIKYLGFSDPDYEYYSRSGKIYSIGGGFDLNLSKYFSGPSIRLEANFEKHVSAVGQFYGIKPSCILSYENKVNKNFKWAIGGGMGLSFFIISDSNINKFEKLPEDFEKVGFSVFFAPRIICKRKWEMGAVVDVVNMSQPYRGYFIDPKLYGIYFGYHFSK